MKSFWQKQPLPFFTLRSIPSRDSEDPLRWAKISRRSFLSWSGWAMPMLVAAKARLRPFAITNQFNQPSALRADYRLTPRYRAESPLDEVMRKTQTGLDAFTTEKYAEEIEGVLWEWSEALKQFPIDYRGIEKFLSPVLEASSLKPAQERLLRSEHGLQISQRSFAADATLGRDEFVGQLRAWINPALKLKTVELKLVRIDVTEVSPGIRTLLRYDLVGAGPKYSLEESIGQWELYWERDREGGLRVRKWRALQETRSRAVGPIFVEITSQALGRNSSYAEQILPGTDYWRTRLDSTCGIDVYGINGVTVGDIDNDGFDDLYVCQPAGLPNRLYRNRGDGTFEDVTEAAGVGVIDNTACALFADVDNDGQQDLIVVRSGGPLLFLNQGEGRFRLRPNAFRFAQPPQGSFTSAALADYDRDGWLDIYLCTYIYYQGQDQYRFPVPYHDAQNGPPNFFLRNNGDGTFQDVTTATNLNQNNNRYSFACGWGDYNNDGWPDLYVANDFGRKNLYRNNGNGTFSDVAAEAGVEDVGAGMSVCWFDYDNDGKQDLYVGNMWSAEGNRIVPQAAFMKGVPEEIRAHYHKHARGNSLFRHEGDSRFIETSQAAGVEMGRWAWSSDAWDFDYDGYPDLYITNGMISGPSAKDLSSFFWRHVVSHSPLRAVPSQNYEQGWNAINELIRSDGTWSGHERNDFFVNNRDGTFSEISGVAGLDFPEDGRAFALSDFDHDGRLEIFLKNRNGPQLRILHNEMESLGNCIAFRLRGRKSNRDAIGTAVTVEGESGRQIQFLQAGSGFLSQHTKELFFGLGKSHRLVRATIRWPSGLVQHFDRLPPGHRIEIDEGSEHFRAHSFGNRLTPVNVTTAVSSIDAPSSADTWLIEPLAAPDFELPDLDGQTHSLSSFRGRPVLLNFWATWCPPCHEELEVFQRYHRRWAAQGLQLVAVNVNDPGEAVIVRSFARERKTSFLVLLASQDVAGIYNILYRYLFDRRKDLGIPTSFLIDESGLILKVYQGTLVPDRLPKDLDRIPRSPGDHVKRAFPFEGTFYGGAFRRNHFTYGVAFFRHSYLDQAAASFQLAIRNNPDYAEAHYNLGTLYLKQRKTAEARQSLSRAIQLRPDYPNALNNLGLVALEEGESSVAIGHFQEAVRRNPNYATAFQNLGNLYRQQGRLAEAQQALEQALQVDPEDPEINYGLGMVFAQKSDSAHAREYLEHAVRFRPHYAEALNNLGVLYLLTGQKEEASVVLRECIRVAPNFDQPYLNLAKVYVAQGQRKQAQDTLRQLLGRNPQHSVARKALAELELER